MNDKSFKYMTTLVERVKEPLLKQLDDRERILLDTYFLHKGDLVAVGFDLGISISQASRLLRRIQFKAEAIFI